METTSQAEKYILETKGLSRSFPTGIGTSVQALSEVSLGIMPGTLTILRGKSGSGKTTLMNLLGALDQPTQGQVFFHGEDIGSASDARREKIRRHQMGYVFQSVSLIPVMSVYENVEFALRMGKVDSGDWQKRVEEALSFVGLSQRMMHMPQELSGGEQQRVAIARAIAHHPDLLFADEPTAELDSQTARKVLRLFRELVDEQGITIVMTTHDTSLMDFGDHIFTLEEGRLVETT